IPLRFAFDRPHSPGWVGAFFDWFRALDAPHNLVPSLHAAFCLLLVAIYARHFRGILRIAILCWFGLIAISPVLTYQHHLLDILFGFALAGYCFYFWRERPMPRGAAGNTRIGARYLAGAV